MIQRDVLQKRFRIFILLSLFILLMEVAGGVFTNSLALLSDAGHVLLDLLALLLAYFSIRLSQKVATKKFTFGFYRAEILIATINGAMLLFVTLYIFYESYIRFLSPQPIRGPEMLIISAVGFLANLYVVVKMQGYEKQNLNVRGAYLHVLSDTLSSVGVVIASILIVITGNYVFDPIISAVIGLFILTGSLRLIRESAHILMEATPKNIDLEKLSRDIQKINGVKEIHDLHVWSISSDVYALSSHVLIDADNIKSMNKIVSNINEMVKSKYNITHTTIQSECETCVDGDNKHDH
ncbi:MAG: cation diffusion facilitator family transporter [Methanocellales archaeon]|nr:cation diffusion facilitator family transporter [Methanocellales archaeon]MDD3291021.1 cation diffusion facilitator family transporter [Methanocellales archaeon]MDD5234906.1 cation diffusion facilitator family transporter [Methanocellales archaeon]MDD5484724.1 cation diffusion facilitator family transporter [Methanocellales archaeon]